MAKLHVGLLTLIFSAILLGAEANFYDTTYFTWGADHSSIQGNGDDLQLVLDKTSGSAFQSKSTYLFGSMEMLIKLVPGNSAGTVTAYYLSSLGDWHYEIDFEFLGNVSGEPYTLHTNIFTQGKGNKEVQFRFWFDPTADYHNYTIHWNPNEVVWYVDSIPIRVFRNYENEGIAFPNKQGMQLYASLWCADDWATQGGRVKTDWNLAPFNAWFRNFRPNACTWYGPDSVTMCANPSPTNWYTAPEYSQLSYENQGQMQWARDNYMIYDYCKDNLRFNGDMPPECYKPQY